MMMEFTCCDRIIIRHAIGWLRLGKNQAEPALLKNVPLSHIPEMVKKFAGVISRRWFCKRSFAEAIFRGGLRKWFAEVVEIQF